MMRRGSKSLDLMVCVIITCIIHRNEYSVLQMNHQKESIITSDV